MSLPLHYVIKREIDRLSRPSESTALQGETKRVDRPSFAIERCVFFSRRNRPSFIPHGKKRSRMGCVRETNSACLVVLESIPKPPDFWEFLGSRKKSKQMKFILLANNTPCDEERKSSAIPLQLRKKSTAMQDCEARNRSLTLHMWKTIFDRCLLHELKMSYPRNQEVSTQKASKDAE